MPTAITKAQRNAYARKLTQIERRFGTLERGTLSRSIDLLKQLRANVAGQLTIEGSFEQFRVREMQANLDAMITQYQGQLTGLSNGAVKGSYRLGQASVLEPLEQLGLTNLYFQPSPAQVNALVDFSADLVGGVSNDLRKVINREIQLASLGGKSVTQTMKDITLKMGIPARKSDPVKGIAYDAERILRTEMNRAHNLAAQSQQTELAQQVPGMRKQWLSTGDARTRMTHLEAHGKVVPVDKPFQVGGASLMFPGDPAGPAHETIMCRCRSVSVIPEVEDLSLPIDAEVQAEKDRRDAEKAKKAEKAAPVAVTPEAPRRELEREKFREFSVTKPGDEAAVDDWALNSSYNGWDAALTPQQREALEFYKADGYEMMNPTLRGDSSVLDEFFTPAEFEEKKRAIDSALSQHRLPNDVRLWRGGSHPEITRMLDSGKDMDDLVGMVIGDDAYISTSLNSDAADDFVKFAGKDAVKFEIQAPRGTYGAYVEYMQAPDLAMQEFEYLLARGTKMEILDAGIQDGIRNVIARVIQ